MHFAWYCRYVLSLLMKLMTGMTKWAVTIQCSGESPVVGRLIPQPSAHKVSCKRDLDFSQGEEGRKQRERETSDGRRMHTVTGWRKKRKQKANGRENGREREIVSKSRSGPGGVQTVSMLF